MKFKRRFDWIDSYIAALSMTAVKSIRLGFFVHLYIILLKLESSMTSTKKTTTTNTITMTTTTRTTGRIIATTTSTYTRGKR